MLRTPIIIKLIPPRALLLPLHDLYPRNIRTVNLNPDLHRHTRERIPQQHGRIDGRLPANGEHDATYWVQPPGLPDEDHIPWVHALRVFLREESRALAFWIENCELRRGYGGYGVGAGLFDVWCGAGDGEWAELSGFFPVIAVDVAWVEVVRSRPCRRWWLWFGRWR